MCFLTSSNKKKENDKIEAPIKDLEVLGDILTKKIENRLILTVEGKIDERKKVVKELIKLSNTYSYTKLKDYEITKFIEHEFKNRGFKIDISTLNYFQSFVGNNLSIINMEIEKLELYKDDKIITKDDIEAISSKILEDNIFDLIDAVSNKNIDKALRIYDDFILLNEEEIKIITMLADQFRLIYQTKMMYDFGYTKQDIIDQLVVHPYRIKLAKEASVTIEEAKIYLMKLFDLDVAIKTGKKDKKQGFKMFLLGI